jgi:glutamine amidotransferase
MIAVVDLGIGNVNSVARALVFLGAAFETIRSPNVSRYDRIIFPGVGSFREASSRLQISGLGEWIRQRVSDQGIPILGICLGMQMMCEWGMEGGSSEGLGLVKGKVEKLDLGGFDLALPHIGWNDVQFSKMKMMSGIPSGACFYFVHSFAVKLEEEALTATSEYGTPFLAAFEKTHVWGTQFHPEKSQNHGIRLIQTFIQARF